MGDGTHPSPPSGFLEKIKIEKMGKYTTYVHALAPNMHMHLGESVKVFLNRLNVSL
jgi:hypothetical protein